MKKQFIMAVCTGLILLCGCEMVPVDPDKTPVTNFDDDPLDSEGRIVRDKEGGYLEKAAKADIRDYNDVIKHFNRSNLPVVEVNGLASDPVSAESAYRLRIGERYIGIYKFDTATRKGRHRLAQIRQAAKKLPSGSDADGALYIMGQMFPAYINGGYVMIDAETHAEATAIIKAFKRFN